MRPRVSTRAAWLVAFALLAGACARRLPPYRGELPPPLARPTSGAEDTEPGRDPSVPAPPGEASLDLTTVRAVGVRFEYDGLERGPHGTTQPFDATYYYAAQRRFGDALREALRGHPVALGPANGDEDLLVTIVLRSMELHTEECDTVEGSSHYSCSGHGEDRECDWEDGPDREVCWWPLSIAFDVHTSHGGAGGRVFSFRHGADGRSGLAAGIADTHRDLATDVAAMLRAGGLP